MTGKERIDSREQGTEIGERGALKLSFFNRHCEPTLQKWQELVNHDKGARQSDFDILSGVDGKRKTADCFASLATTDYRSVTASPRFKNGRNL